MPTRTRLAVQAELPARAILYLRQSTHRDDSISMELQESTGREYCLSMGYTVVGVERDEGLSGRRWDNRPAVHRAIEAIESRDAEVIVLWKWSRLSRSRLDWALAAERVETLGARIESATEAIDVSTSMGRLARGMMTEFAAFESDRIGDVWRETHARRIANGVPINGKPRFGYRYSAKKKEFKQDPVTGPVLAECYRRYIAGESVYSLVRWMNEGDTRPVGGYGPKSDGLWSDRTLRRVMDSGFAAGYFNAGGERLRGVHKPLISEEDWEAYNEARARRRVYRRTERSEYLLSGLIRCSCGSSMNAGLFGAARSAKYRCKAAHEKRTHSGGYVTSSWVEGELHRWLLDREQRLSTEGTPAVLKGAADDLRDLESQIAHVDARLDKLTQRFADGDIPRDSYVRVRDRRQEERAALVSEHTTLIVQQRRPEVIVLPKLIQEWDRLEVAARREILRGLISYVEVTPGRPRAGVIIHPRA